MKKFYITTAIAYVNAPPHIGFAYELILADVLARWHRLRDEYVFFLTGTDDNAEKNEEAAKRARKDVKDFVDENSEKFKELCKKLNISYNNFIRTTESKHKIAARKIFELAYENGDIYKGKYKGLYCQGCEAFYTEKELVNGKCPEHNTEPILLEEESYFFRLSKYKNKIIKLVESKDFIIPKEKKNEILSRLKDDELNDLSVSRINKEWGIITPIDNNHVIYVWFDALINYLSGIDYPDGQKFNEYWPADIHLIGKGINWFHSVIWPAMLMSARIKTPKTILVHGYLTVNGQKIGKSLGNVIDPNYFIENYGVDALRYYLIREIPFGQDGDVNEEIIKSRINNELANELGNLVSRVIALVGKNFKGRLNSSEIDKKLASKLDLDKINSYVDKFEFHNTISEIFKFIAECNKYVNEEKPWEKNGKELEKILYNLLESLRIISILISPFMPETSDKINRQLGIKKGLLKDCKFSMIKSYKISKGGILFKKIE
ncbi:methionine--tRNA ligase [Candidatus Woesearchaeota archaeon]|nr:methionine--tRNA ligase [Candidatus Woesearchaeota archaeon]